MIHIVPTVLTIHLEARSLERKERPQLLDIIGKKTKLYRLAPLSLERGGELIRKTHITKIVIDTDQNIYQHMSKL